MYGLYARNPSWVENEIPRFALRHVVFSLLFFFVSILSQKSINVVLIRANMVAIVEKL